MNHLVPWSQIGKKFCYRLSIWLIMVWMASYIASCGSKTSRPFAAKQKVEKSKFDPTWSKSNNRIRKFYAVYESNRHVELSLKRAQQYLPEIIPIFSERQLPLQLAYLPMVESGFDPKADSGHAVGMWQFTKDTAKDYGLKVSFFRDERLDWKKSTHAAADYLKVLGKRFEMNWELALAAYNGGPNYLKSEMDRQNQKNYWNLKLRPETHNYVPKFIAMLQVAESKYPKLVHWQNPESKLKPIQKLIGSR